MTKKEAVLLADEIYEFNCLADGIKGKDAAMEIANAAQWMIEHIVRDHPKVAEALESMNAEVKG
jgi:hypothetical protein